MTNLLIQFLEKVHVCNKQNNAVIAGILNSIIL